LRFQQSLKLAFVLAVASSLSAMASSPTWVKATNAGGNGATAAYAIKIAPNNDQYIAGQFTGNAKFSSTTLTAQGGTDIFLVKYSATGKLLWALQSGGVENDEALSLSLDTDGNIYVTGYFTDSATFNSTNHTLKTVSGNGQTTYLAKYSPAGNLLWIQTGDSSVNGVNFGGAVAVNSAANTVYVVLGTQGNTTLSSAGGTSGTIDGPWTWHVVLAKYNTAGDFLWAQGNEGSPNSLPAGLTVDAQDNAYFVGWMEDQTTFSSADGHSITVDGFSPAQTNTDYPGDAFVAKYDKNGIAKWVNHAGGYKAIGTSVAVLADGEVSLGGFIGNINYGSASEAETIVTSQPPGPSINLGGGDFTDPYNDDVFFATFTSAGVLERALRYGTAEQEIVTSIKYDAAGDVLIAGLSGAAAGSPNVFVRKYADSNLVWQQTAQNVGLWFGYSTTPVLGVGPAGKLFLAGGYSGTADFGAFHLTASGSSDMFLAELSSE
jgi:hypothetical protein